MGGKAGGGRHPRTQKRSEVASRHPAGLPPGPHAHNKSRFTYSWRGGGDAAVRAVPAGAAGGGTARRAGGGAGGPPGGTGSPPLARRRRDGGGRGCGAG